MKRKTSLERSFDTVSFRDSLRMKATSKKIKLSLTRFSKKPGICILANLGIMQPFEISNLHASEKFKRLTK